jgi:hypothetical protein
LRNARQAVERASYFHALAPLLVVNFHPDDFNEFNLPRLHDDTPPFTNLAELEALLDWIKGTSWIRTEALGRIAESARNGTPLCDPNSLNVPDRIKALIPPIVTRSGRWTTTPGILWGAFRSQLHL